jgi:colanic acid biosynthesis glycosyl transferase WcaI
VRVVFVNRYFFPDLSATSQLLSDVAFHLAETGHEVHVLTSQQLYDSPTKRLPAHEFVRGVQVHRVWTSRFGRGRLIGRASDYISFYLSAALKLFSLARAGIVVVAKTDPPLMSVIASWVARLRGARLVNWLQDVFPEVALELGVKVLRGPLGTWARVLRDASLRTAAVNVVLGECMAERVRARGIDSNSIRVIPNWADGDAITPLAVENNPLREQWGLANKFVVMYSGNMGRAHDLGPIVEAAEMLRHEASLVFLLVGDGAGRAPLEREVASKKLPNVLFRPYQPREQLRYSLTLGDVHLAALKPELEGLIVPSKAYGIFAAGRSMVFMGAKDGELGRLLREFDCGEVVPSGDGKALAKSIVRMMSNRERTKAMGQRARELFDRRFSRAVALAAWEKVLMEGGGS